MADLNKTTTLAGSLSVMGEADDTVYNTGAGIYEDFTIQNHYEKDGKIYQMGIASPSGFQGNSVAFVQLTAPTLLWICDWTLERNGGLAVVPDPSPAVSGWVLLDEWWDSDQIAVAGADGQSLNYRVSGTFVYGCTAPSPNIFSQVVFPLTPWINSSMVTVNFRTISSDMLTKDLTDVQGGVFKPPGNITPAGGGGTSSKGIIFS